MSDLRALHPMHYWPVGREFGCDVTGGFRSSSPASVTCPTCLDDLKGKQPATVADRRQRALEALHDARSLIDELPSPVDPVQVAIEVATQVKVTDDVCEAAQQAFPIFRSVDEARPVLIAAFRAAGFEVVE